MNEGVITVIIPVYNVESFLNECILSVINQTYKNLEIILVDDGSNDSSGNMCDKWANSDPRIKVIHKNNGGLSDARNTGLNNAHGDYISFIDSDDYIDLRFYEIMLQAMNETGADLVTCGRYIYSDRIIKEKHCCDKLTCLTSEEALSEMLQGGLIEEAAWDKLYKNNLIKNIVFPVGELNEDIVVMPKIISSCNIVAHCGKSLYYYRRNDKGITKSGYKKNKNVVFRHLDETKDWIEKYHPDLNKQYKVLEARYSYTTLLGMAVNTNDKKVFRSEYKEYMKRLFCSWRQFILSNRVQGKDKAFSILVLLNLYGAIWNVKQILKGKN